MSPLYPALLGLLLLGPAGGISPPLAGDVARLREMLHDRQNSRRQSQAALLLVQSSLREAADVVRQGLRQTDSPEVFLSLAAAVRLSSDTRFRDDFVTALLGGSPLVRQAAAAALAELADPATILRLQAIAEDSRLDLPARQAALWALGRSGRKAAAMVLLDQLSDSEELLRYDAATALSELTGLNYGLEIARWREWWQRNENLSSEEWLESRLAFQATRSHRLEGDLERARAQVVRLHQQLYSRLPAADRLGHVQALVDHDDPAVRALAVTWSTELLAGADNVGQRALGELLLRLSHDGAADVQRAAVLALGRVAEPRAFERLRSMLQRGPASVRAAAARSLALQARGSTTEALDRQRQVVPMLQKALEDPALEVVVEAAEDLGALGVPEAGPVLTVLLRHPSASVRQAAAQALERVADPTVFDGLLEAIEDPVASVRFSLVGALSHAARDGQGISESQRTKLLARLENLLVRDADPGVRSRATTVLGESAPPAALPVLWKRVQAAEDSRVQEKTWGAIIEIIARTGSLDLLSEWDRTLTENRLGSRRIQLLTEVAGRWQKLEETKPQTGAVLEALVQAHLELNKWSAAFPVVRELLARPGNDGEVAKRLQWLLVIGEQALKEDNRKETLRVVQEAQAFLPRRKDLATEFEKLERQARLGP